MITRANLIASIDLFLAERSTSTAGGGWAPVGPNDVIRLGAILDGIVKLKYGADADGDRPIEWELVDRTRYERLHVFPIPYTHKAPKGQELKAYDEAIYWTAGNLKMMSERLDVLVRCRREHQRRAGGL